VRDLAAAADVSVERFIITSLAPGSVIVTLQIVSGMCQLVCVCACVCVVCLLPLVTVQVVSGMCIVTLQVVTGICCSYMFLFFALRVVYICYSSLLFIYVTRLYYTLLFFTLL